MTKWRDEMAAALPGARARSTGPKIEAQAREMLAAEYAKAGYHNNAEAIRLNQPMSDERIALQAIRAALSLPNVEIRREALEEVVTAWEALPGGYCYSLSKIERWLKDDMKPAVDAARSTLNQSDGGGNG